MYVHLFTYLLIYSFIYFSCLSTYLSILLSVCGVGNHTQCLRNARRALNSIFVLFNAVIAFLRTAFTLKVYVQGKWKTAYCCSSHHISGSWESLNLLILNIYSFIWLLSVFKFLADTVSFLFNCFQEIQGNIQEIFFLKLNLLFLHLFIWYCVKIKEKLTEIGLEWMLSYM